MSIQSRSKEEMIADLLSGMITSVLFYIILFHNYLNSIVYIMIYIFFSQLGFQLINHYFGNLLIFLMKGIKGLSIHIHKKDTYLSYLVFCLYLSKDLFSGVYLAVFSILFRGVDNNQQLISLILMSVLVYLFYFLYKIYLNDIKKYIMDSMATPRK